MSIVVATAQDWLEFNRLAGEQGWDVPQNELTFYPTSLNSFSYALKSANRVQGFVTAVCHGKTAWIGNLIIDPVFRGQGLGGYLFDYVLQQLWKAGVHCVWLTASNQGRPLYERRGFELVDEMVRLRVDGSGSENGHGRLTSAQRDTLYAADSDAWGDTRSAMLSHLAENAALIETEEQTALIQFDPFGGIIGPWFNRGNVPCTDMSVIEQARTLFTADTTVVTDLLASKADIQSLTRVGTVTQGENVLMAVGDRSCCPLNSLLALASLGSMG
jgi:GNAT superfamily N-acetyltransferase